MCNKSNVLKDDPKMGKATIVVGAQFGDEGKGKVTNALSKELKCVVRCTGGNNAGHTVVTNNKKYSMHLLPSSITNPDVMSVIGPGVVIDLEVLKKEIEQLRNAGLCISPSNLIISDRAHIILPVHKRLDSFYEKQKSSEIGTTKRGIGPCYEGKANRTNLRMADLLQSDLDIYYNSDNSAKYSSNIICEDEEYLKIEISEYLIKFKDFFKDFIVDSSKLLSDMIKNGNDILLEGAQAAYLDIDHGTYPFVTSSNCTSSGCCSGSGIAPTFVNEIIGIFKAYTSRVGNGPFPTKQDNEYGDTIRKLGHEFGTTTGRARDCGWLDLVMIKSSIITNGYTSFCMNHLDTIGKLKEFKVCTGYLYRNGNKIMEIDYVPSNLESCSPIYKTFKGDFEVTGITNYDELPENAKKFISYIEKYTGIDLKYIGTGPDEKDIIIKEDF